MTADRIPALLEPIQERLDSSGRQWGVQHKTFTNGDYDRTFESDWNFKPFTQDSAMELAESMNGSKPVQIARAAFREVGEWTPEGTENAPTDQARLLAAVQAVTGIAEIKMNSEHGDPAFVQGWEAAIEEMRARLVAALGGEA